MSPFWQTTVLLVACASLALFIALIIATMLRGCGPQPEDEQDASTSEETE